MQTKSWVPKSEIIGIDFETFYRTGYSVKDLGTYAYVHHPEFAATMVAADDGESSVVCHRMEDFPWEAINGKIWVSHNREFDRYVMERLIALGIVPTVWPSAWYCTAALAGFLQVSRDLKGAAKDLLGVEMSKAVRKAMKGKGPQLVWSQEELDYCAQDAKICRQIWVKYGDKWPAFERDLFEITCDMGRKGIALDVEYVKTSADTLRGKIADCDAALPFTPPLSIKAFREACDARGFDWPKSTCDDDPDFLRWIKNCEHDGGVWVRLMQRRRSLNRTLKVLESMLARVNGEERLTYALRYYGADTGRWSGGDGLNLQNFNRGDVEGIDLRRCLVAGPGKVLGIIDYGQIEARVTLWWAGDYATLRLLADGMDIYEAHARATMGYSDPRPLKDVDKKLRQLAKARTLGLGFGCSGPKFVTVAKVMGGVDLSLEEAQQAVDDYRRSNPGVVGMWRQLDDAARKHIGKNYYLPLPHNKYQPDNLRFLVYRDVAVEGRELTAVVGGRRSKIYGGLLLENAVQSTARQILAEAWIRCVAAGYVPVLSCHDELVFEFDEATAGEDLKAVERIMVEPLAWAAGLPLAAEGKLAKAYEK